MVIRTIGSVVIEKTQTKKQRTYFSSPLLHKIGCILVPRQSPHAPAQLSETRLEPAGTTASEVGSVSEYTTIGAFSYVGGVAF